MTGSDVRAIRFAADLSQKGFAEQLGVCYTTISRIERYPDAPDSLPISRRMAKAIATWAALWARKPKRVRKGRVA